MKKYLLTLAASVFMVSVAMSQTFSLEAKNVMVTGNVDDYLIYNVDVYNNTNEELTIFWKTLDNSLNSSWDYTICDNAICYIGVPDSASFNPIEPNDKGFMKLSVGFEDVPGDGSVTFVLYNEADPQESDTLTFNVSATSTGIAENRFSQLKIYPNPAVDYIAIPADMKMLNAAIYNVTGQIISNVSIEKSAVNVSGLTKGMYILKITTSEGAYIGRFIKN